MNEPQHQPTASEEVEQSLSAQRHADVPNTTKDQDFQPESGAVDQAPQSSRRSSGGEARVDQAEGEAVEEA